VTERPDPRTRPPDPAGTRPKVDPESLLPATVEGEAVEDERPALGPGEGGLLPEVHEPVAALTPAVPQETKHTPRFQFLLGALLAIGAVALAAAVAIALRPEPQQLAGPAAWSPWQPKGSLPLDDIISHVSREYRLANERQLVVVQWAPLTLGGQPAQIALEQPLTSGGNADLLQGTSIVYQFCGLSGGNCALPGKPSAGRVTLMRREALELALYTFRYIGPVDQVVVLLPPLINQHNKQVERDTLLFRRGQLTPLLARPLYATLARRTPSVAGADSSPDADLVKRLTAVYVPSVEQGSAEPGGSPPLLLLKPKLSDKRPASTKGGKSGGLADLSQLLPPPSG
jgi:hypothetical protein